MKKTKGTGRDIRGYYIGIIFILVGVLFIYGVFSIVTRVERNQVKGNAEGTLQFLKSICMKYDDYQLGNLTRDLQTITNKSVVLRSYAGENKKTLRNYKKDQNLTGICILDQKLEVLKTTAYESAFENKLLQTIRKESNAASIVKYPKKTYADQVEIDGRYYNYALVARHNKKGIILCYDDITRMIGDKNEFSLGSLLAEDTFEDNARIVVTNGQRVVGTNVKKLQGLTVAQCPITNVSKQDELWKDKDLFQLSDQGKTWYGRYTMYRGYYLYVFYSEKEVFAGRINYLLISLAGYIVLCVIFVHFRERTRKRRMKQMEKEYHLVSTIASIYAANLLIHLKEDTWEPIVESDRLKSFIGEIKSAHEMLRVFAERCVQPAYREGFRIFSDMDTLDERLQGKSFIGYSFESDGNRNYQTLLIPQRDTEGSLQSVMLVFRNVTEQKKREMEYQKMLRATAEEAERANAAKTDFLRRMSHDIRTPINGIRGMVNIGRTCEDDAAKTEECYEKIMGASDFLLDLVNNVLDMSKLETGEVELEHKAFDLREVLEESLNVVAAQAAQQGIRFEEEKPEGEDWHFIGSPLHIKQIVQNIVSNAVKYNKENGLIHVWCHRISADPEYVTVELGCQDTGVGMSADFQKHAFETFAQEQDAARTTYSGTGLGLPIAKKLVEHMGGTIDFVSEQGKGTTFTITLPLQIDHTYSGQRVSPQKVEESIRGIRILLVEDNELNMEIAEYMLEEKGVEVTKAYDGRTAVELFEKSEPGDYDIILMDIMMPEMDGLEATRAIRSLSRADAKEIPIVAMSANAFADDITRSRAAGMNAHLSKPLDFEEVYETIHAYGIYRKKES